MANPTIGFIDCAFGGGKSEVRKDKKINFITITKKPA
jgi:hypothetical protein